MGKAIIHFEIQAGDVERAKTFYEGVFGWEVEQLGQEQYWVIRTGRGTYPGGEKIGIDGGLEQRRSNAPQDMSPINAFICTIEVDDLDDTLQKIEQAGGKVTVPKAEVPGIGWNAYAKDTEGNTFGVIQNTQQN
jgi:predicted enzyme related to lactoylglutathione lyase